jgi:hypothetical protein
LATGAAKAPILAVQNIIAQHRSLVSIAQQLEPLVEVISSYIGEKNTELVDVSRQLINPNLAGVVKLKNFVAGDNATWQLWEYPRSEVIADMDAALGIIEEETE